MPVYEIYFLNDLWREVSSNRIKIRPIRTPQEIASSLKTNRQKDWIYPFPDRHLFKLPATHEIEINCADEEHRQIPSIVVQSLAFLLGHRLEFADWWTDLRVPTKRNAGFFVRDEEVGPCLERVLTRSESFAPANRRRLANLLKFYNRIIAYYWSWERFQTAYTCLDTCRKIFVELRLVSETDAKGKRLGHEALIREMCGRFNIVIRKSTLPDRVVRFRNNLAHEATWDPDEDEPGMRDTRESILLDWAITDLVSRLICFVLDLDCEYRTQQWDEGRGQQVAFDLRY